MTAVERINQTRWIITFFAAYLQDLNQNCINNEQKQSINIRDNFHFPEVHGCVNVTGPCKGNIFTIVTDFL